MSEVNGLFPTKTRLALLRAVADNKVVHWDIADPWDCWYVGTGSDLAVTARCAEQMRAGWIEPGEPGERSERCISWRITDLGRTVLDA